MERVSIEKDNKIKKLKERYGVIEEIIPERELEETRGKLPPREIREVSLPEILLRIEKIEGKIDILTDFKRSIDERLGSFSESIGEIRSALLEKEKILGKMEKDVQTVMETVSGIELEKLRKLFSKKDVEIEEIRANIEKLDAMIKELQAQLKSFSEAMEKIKSIESLIEASKRMEKKIEKIEEAKIYVSKKVSRVESIFNELSEKAGQIEKQKKDIEKIKDLTMEIVRSLDELSLKFTRFVRREEFEELKGEVEKRLGEKLRVKKEEKEEKKEEKDVWLSLKEKWKRLASY